MNTRNLKLVVVTLSILLGDLVANSVETKTGDRLLLEINRSYYSQRQLEAYILVKRVLLSKNEGFQFSISSQKWSQLLDEFEGDMIIYEDTQRLGSFFPTENAVDAGAKKLIAYRKKIATVATNMQRLGIDKKSMVRFVSRVLQVQAYLRSKSKSNLANLKINKNSRWYQELENRMVYRRFKNADTFQNIYPQRQINNL